MIATFFLTFLVLGLVVAGMALGAIFRNQPIAGSCGGIGNVPGMPASNCTCKKPCAKRQEAMAAEAASEQTAKAEPIHFHRRS